MAEMRPPPPRYRIVEHKGRLIATDTWAENRPTRSDALGAALVLAVCAGSTDPAGQPILKTLNYFDINGPREIVLSPASAHRLGRWLTVVLAAAVSGIILACLFPGAFIVLAVLIGLCASGANTAARPDITRWLDRLGQG